MKIQVAQFIEKLAAEKKYSGNTLVAYQRDLGRFLAYLREKLGQEPALETLTGELIDDYLEPRLYEAALVQARGR